jgi:hypothetical protein
MIRSSASYSYSDKVILAYKVRLAGLASRLDRGGRVLFLLLSMVTMGLGDEIHLVNGDRLSGTIIRGDQATLTVATGYAGEVRIARRGIKWIRSESELHLTLREGRTLVGRIDRPGGGEAGGGEAVRYAVKKGGGEAVVVEPAMIEAIRSAKEQAEYERLLNPGWSNLWAGNLNFGFSLTTGNTRTNNMTLGGTLGRQTRRDKTALYATYINAQNKTGTIGVTTANAIRGGGRYESKIANRLSYFGFADLEYNQIQLLDLRSVLGGGLSYAAVKRTRAELELFGGGSWNREDYATALRRNSGEVLAGQDLTLQVNDRMRLKERFQFFPNLSRGGEFRHTLDTSLTTRITSWMNWSITASNRYLSNQVPGAKRNDLLLTTGVGISFNRR